MDSHKRLIELSQKAAMSNSECKEVVRLVNKTKIPMNDLVLRSVM